MDRTHHSVAPVSPSASLSMHAMHSACDVGPASPYSGGNGGADPVVGQLQPLQGPEREQRIGDRALVGEAANKGEGLGAGKNSCVSAGLVPPAPTDGRNPDVPLLNVDDGPRPPARLPPNAAAAQPTPMLEPSPAQPSPAQPSPAQPSPALHCTALHCTASQPSPPLCWSRRDPTSSGSEGQKWTPT